MAISALPFFVGSSNRWPTNGRRREPSATRFTRTPTRDRLGLNSLSMALTRRRSGLTEVG